MRMLTGRRLGWLGLVALGLRGLCGCVEPSHGSRLYAEFYTGFGPASAVRVLGASASMKNPHYEVWATLRNDAVVPVTPFAVVPSVDPLSPCLMYDRNAELALPGVHAGEHMMQPPPASDPPAVRAQKEWLQGRIQALAANVLAVVTLSDGFAAQTALDLARCQSNSCWLDHAALVPGTLSVQRNGSSLAQATCAGADIPPAGQYCVELSTGRLRLSDADLSAPGATISARYRAHMVSAVAKTDPMTWSNADRLRACGLARQRTVGGAPNPAYDPDFYVGSPLELTAPENGVFYGLVDGFDPTGAPRGGVVMKVPVGLAALTELFITVEDRSVGAPDPALPDQVDALYRGPLVLDGRAVWTGPGTESGVAEVDLRAPANITIGGSAPSARVAVYAQSESDQQF